MPTSTPEALGVSSDALGELSAALRALVDERKLAGVIALIARRGSVVYFDTYGAANATTGEPLRADSIFRIASMTKPIVGVAMMQLWEQGKWKLEDPVSIHIPEFADLQVRIPDGGRAPQASPMTMLQLMTHMAGFGDDTAYAGARLSDTDLQGMIDRLKDLPLESQPGSTWDYGPSVNIQGYLVQKLSGRALDVYLEENIFLPLRMRDTSFWVPDGKASRVVALHSSDADGTVRGPRENRFPTARPEFLSGSGGLLSTAEDYWRFAQALANGGILDGRRILGATTATMLRTNMLPSGMVVDPGGVILPGTGFGLGVAVVLDPEAAGTPQGAGAYYWGGSYGTWFWVDPRHDLVFVAMMQNRAGPNLAALAAQMSWTYSALDQ